MILTILFRHFGFIAPKTLNYFAFQSFNFERIWWRLFWAYLMMVILSVPDEGYSSNVPDEGYSSNVPDEGYSSNVPDEGYSSNASCALNLISTFISHWQWNLQGFLGIYVIYVYLYLYPFKDRGCRDRMVVGFTITNAISAYHHWCCELESWAGRSV